MPAPNGQGHRLLTGRAKHASDYPSNNGTVSGIKDQRSQQIGGGTLPALERAPTVEALPALDGVQTLLPGRIQSDTARHTNKKSRNKEQEIPGRSPGPWNFLARGAAGDRGFFKPSFICPQAGGEVRKFVPGPPEGREQEIAGRQARKGGFVIPAWSVEGGKNATPQHFRAPFSKLADAPSSMVSATWTSSSGFDVAR